MTTQKLKFTVADRIQSKIFSLAVVTIFISTLLSHPQATAAIQQKRTEWLIKSLKADGYVTGGVAGSGFSLLGVDVVPRKKSEMIKITLGDRNGLGIKTSPPYHHIQYSKNGLWVQIDFSQMARSLIEENAIRNRFKKSKFVRNIDLTQDPGDGTYNLRLQLKRPLTLRTAVSLKKPKGELYIELLPQ